MFLGHYAAYRCGRVLHRDLSVNNLMIDWDESNDHHIGILSDWNLASLIDKLNDAVPTHLSNITGMVLFVSVNLLSALPPSHQYFHDLESSLYILVWASVHFTIEKHRCEQTHPKFKLYLAIVSEFKSGFMLKPDGYEMFVKEEFRELFDTWIDALRIMFADAYFSREIVNKGITRSAAAFGRLEKSITFESFMAAIGREPRYTYTY